MYIDIIDSISCVGIGNLGDWGVIANNVPLCIDSNAIIYLQMTCTILYTYPEYKIKNLGPGDTLIWNVKCGGILLPQYTEVMTYDNYNTILFQVRRNNSISSNPLNNESCGCLDPVSSTYNELFEITAEIISSCGNGSGSSI